MAIQLVDEASFEGQVLRSELPVLVDLYADWCEPCKKLEPILEDLAAELSGKVKIVRIDVERSPVIARSFGVQSIPMLVLLHEGRPVDHVMGLVDKKRLLQMLAPVIPRSADELEPAELLQLIQSGQALAVDIRDASDHARYRVPGARHVARSELSQRAAELAPADGRIRVLYSRTTDDARDAAKELKDAGVQVAFLKGGFLYWEADGLEVERGGA
ncbi:MAG: thioredoxin domain-containing protein [Myxococcales bacterium]|nr:thioredoxin domain-containing protein [Myxococcales bacterium]MDD9965899.1 thioredoxin domain-containing protein [Myxococcales bacterium]